MKVEPISIFRFKSILCHFKIFVALAFLQGWQDASTSIKAQRDVALCPQEIRVESGDFDELVLMYQSCEEGGFEEGDEIKVVFLGCEGGNSDANGIEYLLEFNRCEENFRDMPFPADITFAIPEGEDLLRFCGTMEVHLPNGKVAYYSGERIDMGTTYFLDECLMPCTAMYLKDAWGGLIDVSFPPDVTIENEPHSMEYIDFGCVEICRMATRTFNLMPCEVPLELQDITALGIFDMDQIPNVTIYQDPLLTGMEICPEIDVELPPYGWCCPGGDGGNLVQPSFRPQCLNEGGAWFPTEQEAYNFCNFLPRDNALIDQINAQIKELVLDGCYMTIHGIHISQAPPTHESAEANVPHGDSPFELISPDPMNFPINVTLGSNLEFEIKFKPGYSGPFYGSVEICFENSCPCKEPCPPEDDNCCNQCPPETSCVQVDDGIFDCVGWDASPPPNGNGHGFVCEYSTLFFDIFGYGANCYDYEGYNYTTEPATTPSVANNAALHCGDKCPPCISMASALQPVDDEEGLVCGGYELDYLVGRVSSPQKSADPQFCGELCLVLTNGSNSLLVAEDDDGLEWNLVLPGMTVVTNCNGDFSHPGFPFLYLDDDNDVLYLVKSGDSPPIVIDLILTLPYTTNCGNFEPGETFTIIQGEDILMFEYIACDGFYVFARAISTNIGDLTDEYFAEFPHLGTYARYFPINCSDNGGVEYCGMWYVEECHNFRTDLFVVDEEEGLLCNQKFLHHVDLPQGGSEPGTESTLTHKCFGDEINFGCTVPGEPISRDFVIINCDDPFISRGVSINQINGPANIPFEVTCVELFPVNETLLYDIPVLDYVFGTNCAIHIEEIFFVGKEECGPMLLNEGPNAQNFPLNGTPHDFSLVSPSLPAWISKGESIGLEIEFKPEEPGTQCAYVVICYENDCPSCNLTPALPEGFEAAGFLEHDFPCNTGKVFVFEIEGCSVGFEVTDKDPTSEDPCSCEDERNITNPNTGQVLFFHDVLKIIPGEGDESSWFLNAPLAGTLYDESGNPLGGYPIPATTEMMNGMEVFIWHIWHQAGELVTVEFENEEGDTLVRDVAICEDICTPIPTLGQWGIIALTLLMLIFGTVAVRQRSMKMHLKEK